MKNEKLAALLVVVLLPATAVAGQPVSLLETQTRANKDNKFRLDYKIRLSGPKASMAAQQMAIRASQYGYDVSVSPNKLTRRITIAVTDASNAFSHEVPSSIEVGDGEHAKPSVRILENTTSHTGGKITLAGPGRAAAAQRILRRAAKEGFDAKILPRWSLSRVKIEIGEKGRGEMQVLVPQLIKE